ncbi:MAG TPA: enoyl-CoA hydratase/isomerase family protein [Dehalococcoidia bacterium]|nr:enoyl-CoA hydratase/isomerase family protein [Dehalococcoidia bacterium]
MPEYVLIERYGKRAELVLNRPEKRNALIVPMMDEMREAIEAFASDDEVSVVLIRGAGGTFCAGMDLEARRADPPPPWLSRSQEAWADFHAAVWNCGKPVVGAVERAAIAGGTSLCFACDFIIAGETARIGATEARLGMANAPMNLAWLIARWGYNAAVQITQSAKLYSGRELKDMGLAFDCVPDDQVLDRARALADELAQNPVAAMVAMKRHAQRALGIDFPALLKRLQGRA